MSGLREPLCGLQAKPPSPMQVTSSDQSPPAPPTWGPLGLHTPPPMRVWVSRSTISQKQMATVLPLYRDRGAMVLSSIHTTFAPGLQRHCPPNLLTNGRLSTIDNVPSVSSPFGLEPDLNVIVHTVNTDVVDNIVPNCPSGPNSQVPPSVILEEAPCVPTTSTYCPRIRTVQVWHETIVHHPLQQHGDKRTKRTLRKPTRWFTLHE